ncbi:hypothetical protein X801_09018 [Opisthorchis viverrini]|uniref:Cytochrome c oxidase polypeptide VIIc n=1 Tax=Opisthorchis viverrini TaxID=6198 RepID=A0A1S8WLG3_OPIVI|nr:hypothetical protein X801_09018 [Opisthorchis viverrini]
MASRNLFPVFRRSVLTTRDYRWPKSLYDKWEAMDKAVDIEGKGGGILPFKQDKPYALLAKMVLFISTAYIPPFIYVYLHMKPPG